MHNSRSSKHLTSLLALVAAVCVLASAWTVATAQRSRPSNPSGKPMPLVNSDPDVNTIVARIEMLIRDQAYSDAIELLQKMIEHADGFIEADNTGRRWDTLATLASKLLAQMGEEGMALYRIKVDPIAQRLHDEGLANGDVSKLQAVTTRYFNSSLGVKSLDTIGSLHFDGGRFHQAAAAWGRLLKLTPSGDRAALLQAKCAVALHLAGEKALALGAAAELKKLYPAATGNLGGQEQNLVAFVEQVQTLSPQAYAVTSMGSFREGWPGWGSMGSNWSQGPAVNVVLSPRWRASKVPPEELLGNVRGKLMIPDELFAMSGYNPYTGGQTSSELEVKDGQVKVRTNSFVDYRNPNRMVELVLPPMVHTVVVDNKVIFRIGDEVIATNILDGNVEADGWKSRQPFLRTVKNTNNRGNMASAVSRFVDNGRLMMTVGGNSVFLLSNFRQAMTQQNNWGMPAQPKAEEHDGSTLVALDHRNGKKLWAAGGGEGEDEFLRTCKFISAPAYDAGRVFAMAIYLENYYVICLDSEQKGALVWKQLVAQPPVMGNQYGYAVSSDQYQMGTPPVVADGRVFVVTNAGVAAALDVGSGLPLWAYQYESSFEKPAYDPNTGAQRQQAFLSANPMTISRGRLIVLPSDSTKVLAINCEDGSVAWQIDRQSQIDLTPIDEGRFALSGDGLSIYSASDGKLIHDTKLTKLIGRPAVTTDSIAISGEGKLFTVGLKEFDVSSVDLSDGNGILGNLVAVDGRLVASNLLGVCTYFRYEDAREQYTQKIAKATGAQKARMLLVRGQLAMDGQKIGDALDDFLASHKLAQESKDNLASAQVRMSLYLAYVTSGKQAAKGQEMLEAFQNAAIYADSDAQKAQMKLRLARAYDAAGQYEKAVDEAHELMDKYGSEELVDDSRPSIRGQVRFDESDTTISGRMIARNFLARMIETRGRKIYAKYDAPAEEACKAALAKADIEALLEVEQRWPNSVRAFDAIFAVAEINYRNSRQANGEKSLELYQAAIDQLSRVYNEPASTKHSSATVALAWLYAQGKGQTYASILLERVRDLPPQTDIAFADIRGKLGDMILKIDGGKVAHAAAVKQAKSLEVPLRKVFTHADVSGFILRDHEYRPVRVGEAIAVLQGTRVVMMDTSAKDHEMATTGWSGVTNADSATLRNSARTPATSIVGGLSADGKLLVVADSQNITAMDMTTAKIKWTKTRNDLELSNFQCMAIGSGVLIMLDGYGKVSCLDLAAGEMLWQANLAGTRQQVQPIGVPMIGGQMVAIISGNARNLTVLNLKTGKLEGKWENKTVDAVIAPNGLLVTAIDGEVCLRQQGQIERPIWTKTYESKQVGLVAADSERVAVAAPRNGKAVEVLSVTGGGRVLATHTVAGKDGVAVSALDGVFNGSDLYVSCGLVVNLARRANAAMHLQNVKSASVQKFPADKVVPAWTLDIAGDPNLGSYVMPLVVSDKHIVVTAKNMRPDAPGKYVVLDGSSGKMVEEIEMSGGDGPGSDKSRYGAIGIPVMTKGRLSVETFEGVTVHGK